MLRNATGSRTRYPPGAVVLDPWKKLDLDLHPCLPACLEPHYSTLVSVVWTCGPFLLDCSLNYNPFPLPT